MKLKKKADKKNSESSTFHDGSKQVKPKMGFTFSEESKHVLRDLFTRHPPHQLEISNKFENEPIRNHDRRQWDNFFMRCKMTKEEIANRVASLATKVQQDDKLRQIHEKVSKLPITKFKDIITSTVESNQVVLISGETGCGKTTQVPQFLLDHMWAKGETCKVVCSQPRRISAMSVSQRIASERGEECGGSVGYKVRFESAGGKKSSIVFCTNGVLLKILVSKGNNTEKKEASGTISTDPLSHITHIVVDEIHERDQFADLMLAILRDMLPSYPNLRLILMSATLNAERFSQYFGGCPIIRVPGFTYPVTSFYLEDILALLSSNDQATDQEKHLLLEKYLSTSDPEEIDIDMDLIIKLVVKICTITEDGAILVFLPGWYEIINISERLEARFSNDKEKFKILCLHSMVPPGDQKKVFECPPEGCRKIVLSTNVAETSVTIDDVVFVIDSGKAKESNYDPFNNVSTLNSLYISKASARQRQGRAGRCQPGVCYHVYSRNVFDSMIDFQIPEIQRIPIEELCLQVKILDPDCYLEEFLQKTLDPPIPETIQNAIKILQDIGALSSDEKLTDLGKKIGSLPVHPQMSKMLLVAILTSCLDPALTLAVTTDYKDIFSLPFRRGDVRPAKSNLSILYGGYSDQLAVIAAYEVFKVASKTKNTSDICQKYHISENTMAMIVNMRRKLESELERIGFIPKDKNHLNLNSHDQGVVGAVLVAAQYPMVGRLISKNLEYKSTFVKTYGGSKVKLHGQSLPKQFNFDEDEDQPLIVYDEVVKLDSGLVIRNCSLIAPLALLLLATEIIVVPTKQNMSEDVVMSNPRNEVNVIVDRWIRFESTAIDAAQIYWLRERLSNAITHMINNPSNNLPKLLEDSVQAITAILTIDGKLKFPPMKCPKMKWEKSEKKKKADSLPENSSDPKSTSAGEKSDEPSPKKMNKVDSPPENSSEPKLEDSCQNPRTGEKSDETSRQMMKKVDSLGENSSVPKSEDTCQNPSAEEKSEPTPQKKSRKRNRKKKKVDSSAENSSNPKSENTCQNPPAGEKSEPTPQAKSDEPSPEKMKKVDSPSENSSDQKSEVTCQNPPAGQKSEPTPQEKCGKRSRKRKKKVDSLAENSSDPKSENKCQNPPAGEDSDEPSRKKMKNVDSSAENPSGSKSEDTCQNLPAGVFSGDVCPAGMFEGYQITTAEVKIVDDCPVELCENSPMKMNKLDSRSQKSSDPKLEDTCQNPPDGEKSEPTPQEKSGKRSRRKKKKVDSSAENSSGPKLEDTYQNPPAGLNSESTPHEKSDEPSREKMKKVDSPSENSSDQKSEDTCQNPPGGEKSEPTPQEKSGKRSRKRKKKVDSSAKTSSVPKSEDTCQNPPAGEKSESTPQEKSDEPSSKKMKKVDIPSENSSDPKSEVTYQNPPAGEKSEPTPQEKSRKRFRKKKKKVDSSAENSSDPKSEDTCQNPPAGEKSDKPSPTKMKKVDFPSENSSNPKSEDTCQNPPAGDKSQPTPQEKSRKRSRKVKKKTDSLAENSSDLKSEYTCQNPPAGEKSDEPSTTKMKKVDSPSENSSDPKSEETCQNPSAGEKSEPTPQEKSRKRFRMKKKKIDFSAENSSDLKFEDTCQNLPARVFSGDVCPAGMSEGY